MKLLATIGAALLLCSCATSERALRVVPINRLVPVASQCTETVTRPVFALDQLKDAADLEEKVSALLADDFTHRGFENDLMAALVKCSSKIK